MVETYRPGCDTLPLGGWSRRFRPSTRMRKSCGPSSSIRCVAAAGAMSAVAAVGVAEMVGDGV